MRPRGLLPGLGPGLLLGLVPVLVVGLAFSAGGFFPGPAEAGALVLIGALVGRITLAKRPFAGLGAAYVGAAAALGLLAGLALLSAVWSDAPARAILEHDRALLYLLAFVVVGSVGRTDARVRWLVRGLALAAFVVCASALVTRVLPDVWAIPADLETERLSFPLTYRNALGILAAIGLILAFGLSADAREHAVARVLASAVLPVFAVTLFFTLSRGSMAAGAAGLLATVLLGRSFAVLSALLAALPVALAVKTAYAADLLVGDDPASAAAIAQGHEVAVAVAACSAAAGAIRALLLLLDQGTARIRTPRPLRHRGVKVAAAVAVLAALAGGAVAAGAVDIVTRQYDRTLANDKVQDTGDERERLTDPGNGGRLAQWRVALRESEGERLLGTGAGTYALLWDRGRGEEYDAETVYQVEDAHSLYVEMLAELGIVGLALLVAAILLILAGCVWRARGPGRGPYAAIGGAGLAWALHAGVDWDWEMPAVTVWLFAAGGLVLASTPPEDDGGDGMPRLLRILAAIGVLLLAVVPGRMLLSQSPLDDARKAFARNDCPTAVDRALDSIAALPSRPEPFEILAFCDIRLGEPELAVRAAQNAVQRDPRNWEYRYALAIVRGAAGEDPRPAAREAVRRNPMSRLARETAEALDVDDPQKWRRRALRARRPRD